MLLSRPCSDPACYGVGRVSCVARVLVLCVQGGLLLGTSRYCLAVRWDCPRLFGVGVFIFLWGAPIAVLCWYWGSFIGHIACGGGLVASVVHLLGGRGVVATVGHTVVGLCGSTLASWAPCRVTPLVWCLVGLDSVLGCRCAGWISLVPPLVGVGGGAVVTFYFSAGVVVW